MWFTTRVNVNERRLVDLFQTNTTEAREQLFWYRTNSLKDILNFYRVFNEKPLPYQKCFYHVSRVHFFESGYHNVTVTISTNGLSAYDIKFLNYIYIDLEENVRCEPLFDIPRCHDSNRPLHYETSEVIVLRAVFSRRCPMDNFIRYYWTLHDSTESHLLEFLGGTLRPELKLSRYRLQIRVQCPLNRMVMIRINARVVGRRTPLVARCYLVLASQRVYAAIRGGQNRKVFRGKTIFFNASPSRDLSLPETALQQLLYHWTCQAIIFQVY
ncbi:uncharacterized protein LOC117793176 [Drosophila innubila]|uniref:uncharacterized protein LOC117793176 n=1 Tax=Drosophila innubila TaxID=198719 RepID=UPI00148E3694|nr:uncharacterized protein LOC117793176 [Drosophila innubila]